MKNFYTVLLGLILLQIVPAAAQYCPQTGGGGGFSFNPSHGCAPLEVQVANEVAGGDLIKYAYDFDRTSIDPPAEAVLTEDTRHIYPEAGTFTIVQVGSAHGTGFHYCNDITVYETAAPEAQLVLCPDGKALLTLLENKATKVFDGIIVNWGDGSPHDTWKKGDDYALEHQYTVPFSKITVYGSYQDGRCSGLTQPLVLTAANSATSLADIKISSLEMLSNGRAKVTFQGMQGIKTAVWLDEGTGTFVDTGKATQGAGVQIAYIENLDPTKRYRFALVSRDICDNPVQSEIVSNMVLEEGSVTLDEIVSVTWKSLPHSSKLSQYQLKRDGKVIFSSPNAVSYIDNAVQCGKTYRYELLAVLENGAVSHSNELDLVPTSSAPEKIINGYVSVLDPGQVETRVSLTGVGLTSTYDLIVERSEAGGAGFVPVSPDNNQALKFLDSQVHPAQRSYCYRFIYENACQLRSPPSDAVCTVLLNASAAGLEWTTSSPFLEGIDTYFLEVIDESGSVIDAIPKGKLHNHLVSLNDQSMTSYQYRAKVLGAGGEWSYSNVLMFSRDPILLVPDAFSPNGDGINEYFEVKAYFTTRFVLSVFDRWGGVVFRSEDPAKGWDGYRDGSLAAEGYYTYKIEVTDIGGQVQVRKGGFLLLR
ncbi:gliding motility-associated-like protein [Dyadobacter jejuensis]|uniref:Gliding motility-associated-like protein n=1 Tax=Dyadobacter jejuensis TaxID=1082580 RepID=A0A316AHX1_9BACT|nr:gliding motility-associated C-terminal domain-containing protein [Dyadobacter jejuensis]PWJ56530.1 gliding motility-associated-like protein [Dyadobacter jejuensis]